MKYSLPQGAFLMCKGILHHEQDGTLPGWYKEKIANAEREVGKNYTDETERQKLIEAVKLSTVNRKDYPYELLQRKYMLPIGRRAFHEEKQKFLSALCKVCKFK